jgi:hypothetical protein
LVYAFFELFLNCSSTAEFLVQLQVEFDIKRGSFGLNATKKRVIDEVGGGADGGMVFVVISL